MASNEFDSATTVVARPDQSGVYDADLGEGWRIGAGINGGLLLAVVGSAVRSALGAGSHADPLAVSAHYLSTARPGAAAVRTRVLRAGRGLSTVSASLVQGAGDDELERFAVLATYGDLGALGDEVATTARAPEMPPPQDCLTAADAPPAGMGDSTALLERLDLRLDPACVGWAVGRPSGRGLIQGWLRLADGRDPDPLMLLLAVDALPPVSFDLGRPGWAPTLELTAHVRARPVPGWLRVRHATRNVAGGLLEEDAEVWDEAGRLVAQSRQLARMPR